MKRYISAILVLCFLLQLFGCDEKDTVIETSPTATQWTTIATDWAPPDESVYSRKTDTLDLSPYSRVEVRYTARYYQQTKNYAPGTTFYCELPNNYEIIYMNFIQIENPQDYHFILSVTKDFNDRIPNKVVFHMSVYGCDSTHFYNLKISGTNN